MSTAKVRVSGSWVDSDLAGKHRVSGSWVDFGPSGGTAYEALSWPNPVPNLLDADDLSTRYNMGVMFTVLTAKNCVGVQWRTPTNTPSPTNTPYPVGHSVSLWDGDLDTHIVSKDFTPVPGGYQDILFDTPVPLLTANNYIAAVYTFHYVHRAATWPVTSPSGNVSASIGRLVADQGPMAYPGGNSNAWFYVSPLVEV